MERRPKAPTPEEFFRTELERVRESIAGCAANVERMQEWMAHYQQLEQVLLSNKEAFMNRKKAILRTA